MAKIKFNSTSFRTSYDVYLKAVSNCKVAQYHRLSNETSKLIDKIDTLMFTKGGLYTIGRIKFIRHQIYIVLAGGSPVTTTKFPIYKSGIPKDLGPWLAQRVEKKDLNVIRDILTLLQVSYIIPEWKEPNYSTITEPSNADEIVMDDITEFFDSDKCKLKFSKPSIYWENPHNTSKSGPNGPALITSHDDLFTLTDEQVAHMTEFAGNRFGIFIENCVNARDYLLRMRKEVLPLKKERDPKDGFLHGKISIIKSPEGKSRIIAIFDYWSQTVLKPLHDWAFTQLREIKTDRTFDQDDFESRKCRKYYASYDLSAATDRFPIKLQEKLLATLIGDKKANAWCKIMVDRDFQRHDKKGTVRYAAGQPMGAYSSWAIFSLSHHIVVQYAAYKTGYTGLFTGYSLLGDDIVIYSKPVGETYKLVMNSLGVEIQPDKSLVSEDTFEFAKRIFYKEEEITAFPLAAVIANHKSVSALWSVTLTARKRGYSRINSYAIPRFIQLVQSANNVNFRSTLSIARYYEAMRVLSYPQSDHALHAWGLRHMYKSLDRELPCRSDLILCEENLVWDLGYFIMKYKASLVDASYKQFIELSFKITGRDWDKGGIEGMSSHKDAPIDIMRVPIIWVCRLAAEGQTRDIQILKRAAQESQFKLFLTMTVSPIGDLNRLMSHTVNKHTLSRHDAMLKSLKIQQTYLNHLLKEAYQGRLI